MSIVNLLTSLLFGRHKKGRASARPENLWEPDFSDGVEDILLHSEGFRPRRLSKILLGQTLLFPRAHDAAAGIDDRAETVLIKGVFRVLRAAALRAVHILPICS